MAASQPYERPSANDPDELEPGAVFDPDNAPSQQQGQSQSDSRPGGAPLSLPAPPETSNLQPGETKMIEVGGGKVTLDHLGPMVVNSDGTLSRIHNWPQMTPAERERTLRVLGKRNQLRIEERRSATPSAQSSTQGSGAGTPASG